MENFWKLKVVRKAHQLVLEVYKITKEFPEQEKFGLVPQMRRSAVSVVANIVEASKRKSVKDRKNFHVMADGSLEELKYYIILSFELGYFTKEKGQKLTNLAREVGAMLAGLTKSLKA